MFKQVVGGAIQKNGNMDCEMGNKEGGKQHGHMEF